MLPGLFLLASAIIILGCEGPSQKATGQPTRAIPENVMAQASQIVLDGLSDPNPDIRAKAVEVVAVTRQVRMLPRVQRLLKDQIVPVRFLAVVAVGDLEYALAKSDIIKLLKDRDENVRIAAAYTMVKLGSAEYFQVICSAVASDNQTVRANAALLLGKSGKKESLKYLYWTLRQNNSADKVVLQAAESIALLGDEQIYPKLWTRLISAYADDRVVGIRGMGALATEQARNALVTMLDDSVLEVRLAAAEQLGRLRDPIGEAEVLGVFNKNLTAKMDPESKERVEVLSAMAIGAIGTNNLTRYLPQLIKDESKLVRIAAAKAVLQTAMAK
jgi:HEAT repeat protein